MHSGEPVEFEIDVTGTKDAPITASVPPSMFVFHSFCITSTSLYSLFSCVLSFQNSISSTIPPIFSLEILQATIVLNCEKYSIPSLRLFDFSLPAAARGEVAVESAHLQGQIHSGRGGWRANSHRSQLRRKAPLCKPLLDPTPAQTSPR